LTVISRLAEKTDLPSGEIQIWDVAKRKLLLSLPATYDTVYGASWSPDGALIAFGAADNGVRAIDAKTGEQAAFMAAHEDWVRGTVFSPIRQGRPPATTSRAPSGANRTDSIRSAMPTRRASCSEPSALTSTTS